MESTPRPIVGYARTGPGPLGILARRLSGSPGLSLIWVRPGAEETVLEVQGPLDGAGARRLKAALEGAIAEGALALTVDLSQATKLTAPGIAALVELSQRGVPLKLARLRPEARHLLERAGLHAVLEIME